jgi:hypothetical protein
MHLGVDDTRQNMQAPAIDDLLGGGPRQISKGGDLALSDPDVGNGGARRRDACPAAQNPFHCLSHWPFAFLFAAGTLR